MAFDISKMAKPVYNAAGKQLISGRQGNTIRTGGALPEKVKITNDDADSLDLRATSIPAGGGAGGNINFKNEGVAEAVTKNKPIVDIMKERGIAAPAPKPEVSLAAPPTVQEFGTGPSTKIAAVSDIDASKLSPEARQAQLKLLSLLTAAAEGKGPSAAQAQLKAGTDANINAAMAQAASARGQNRAGATRSAINAGALANQQGAQQAALLRAQEMQAAYGLMGTTAQNIQAQDAQIALANMQKQLQFNVAQGNISSEEARAVYNANAQRLIKQAELASATRGQDINERLGMADIKMRGDVGLAQAAAARQANRAASNASRNQLYGSILSAGAVALPVIKGMFSGDEGTKSNADSGIGNMNATNDNPYDIGSFSSGSV